MPPGFYSETDPQQMAMLPRLKVGGCRAENVGFSVCLYAIVHSNRVQAPANQGIWNVVGDELLETDPEAQLESATRCLLEMRG